MSVGLAWPGKPVRLRPGATFRTQILNGFFLISVDIFVDERRYWLGADGGRGGPFLVHNPANDGRPAARPRVPPLISPVEPPGPGACPLSERCWFGNFTACVHGLILPLIEIKHLLGKTDNRRLLS